MNPVLKKRLLLTAKLAIAAAILGFIYREVFRKETHRLAEHLAELSWPLVALCAVAFGVAIGANVVRWNLLLRGQGIRAPWTYLGSTFMIARYFAAAGGLIGLSGFRLYDIATRTKKTARAAASIGIEMVIGNMAMACVALVTSLYGVRYVGATGVALLVTLFAGVIGVALVILTRPQLVRVLSGRLPGPVRSRLATVVEAVAAYEGQASALFKAVGLGILIHICNNLVYVLAARALGVQLPFMELFFVSTLQNIVSHLPLTPNGVGLREATAVSLYTIVGLPTDQAVLIPLVGFAVDTAVSLTGGLFLLARRGSYHPAIEVLDDEREARLHAQIEHLPESERPRLGRGAAIGLGAGLLSGLVVGAGEAAAVFQAAEGRAEPDVWLYGTVSYGLLCGALGGLGGLALAWSGRLLGRRALQEPVAFAHEAGAMTAGLGLVLGLFRVKRDVFHEELAWASSQGLTVLASGLGLAALTYAVAFYTLRFLTARKPAELVLRPLGSISLAASIGLAALALAVLPGERAAAFRSEAGVAVQGGGKSVLFIVVDTLRADHLPVYGYQATETPALDALARDSVLFEHAYANASWTRPSFASLLTGRYASSHGVMSKAAALPADAETLAERFSAAGYATLGVVTNYNVAPFFNFQQGFDAYRYLAPSFLFGASDTAAKLSLLQVLKRVDEKGRALLEHTEPGSAYQDAETVNRTLLGMLDELADKTFFAFVGYMDPHDPYFRHPYDGFGYSRAAHVKPAPEEAELLRSLYDGEIRYWDAQLGELVAALKARNLYDDLTIVVTSDHGEEFMDHGGFWHGTTLYDEQLHVPLLIKLPRGEQAGSSVSHWVESVDIMPTLLGRAGVEVPSAVQGVDLFRGKLQTFAEESHDGNVLRALRYAEDGRALKLIEANAQNPRGLAERELYRVDTDPGETKNLAGEAAETLAQSERALDEAAAQAERGALKAREVDLSVDQAAQDRLRALGYAGE